jgi:hypothetical protein
VHCIPHVRLRDRLRQGKFYESLPPLHRNKYPALKRKSSEQKERQNVRKIRSQIRKSALTTTLPCAGPCENVTPNQYRRIPSSSRTSSSRRSLPPRDDYPRTTSKQRKQRKHLQQWQHDHNHIQNCSRPSAPLQQQRSQSQPVVNSR